MSAYSMDANELKVYVYEQLVNYMVGQCPDQGYHVRCMVDLLKKERIITEAHAHTLYRLLDDVLETVKLKNEGL